ncbi:MAG: hypothetical protein GX550_07550 [Syntrophomonadaceae bacterium]|nr:hypothetical protein [Syntrophomonadaceae bacterium]
MLVIIILIAILLLWLMMALPRREFKSLIWVLLITGIWAVTWLMLLQYELIMTGSATGTYGSDATYYYNAMCAGYFADNPTQAISSYYNQLYIWFGIILLKASPFCSIIWVKLGNIILLLYIISMIYLMLYRAGVTRQITVFICLFAGLNGIVTWMCIRNLKDTLFLFLFVVNCFFAFMLYKTYKTKSKNNTVIYSIVLLVLSIVLSRWFRDIRQWAYIIPWLIITSLIVRILMDNKSINRFIPILGVAGLLMLPLIIPAVIGADVVNNFETYASTVGLGGKTGHSIISGIIIGLLRFILGPGPIRAMMGNDIFLVTNNIGNALIFLGALMWWLVIPLMVLRIKELIKIIPKEIIIFTPFLIYVFIYVYVYQGSVETRFRAVLYVISMLLWGLTYAYYQPKVSRTHNRQLAYIICAFFVLALGTLATYFSLS